MKTHLAIVISAIMLISQTSGKCSDPDHLQKSIQDAVGSRSENSLIAVFNLGGVSPLTKEKIQEIAKDILSWDEVKVTVEPFSPSRTEEFKTPPKELNGTPTADVIISSASDPQKSFSMLAGDSPSGFLILLPKEQ